MKPKKHTVIVTLDVEYDETIGLEDTMSTIAFYVEAQCCKDHILPRLSNTSVYSSLEEAKLDIEEGFLVLIQNTAIKA